MTHQFVFKEDLIQQFVFKEDLENEVELVEWEEISKVKSLAVSEVRKIMSRPTHGLFVWIYTT